MTDTNGTSMYIGPTVRGVVRHGATFSSGIPSRLENLVAAMPIMRNLIVPLSTLESAITETNTEGAARAVAYDRVLALSQEDVKKLMEGV